MELFNMKSSIGLILYKLFRKQWKYET